MSSSSRANSVLVSRIGRSPRVTSRVPGSSRRSAKLSEASGGPAWSLLGAAQQRAQPGEQLFEVEGLDEVVVGSRVEARDAVGDRVARGENQDGYVVAVRAQSAAGLEATDARHHHVEHQRVGPLGAQPIERLTTVGSHVDVVAVEGQRAAQRLAHGPVVVDHEDAHPAILPRTSEPILRNRPSGPRRKVGR